MKKISCFFMALFFAFISSAPAFASVPKSLNDDNQEIWYRPSVSLERIVKGTWHLVGDSFLNLLGEHEFKDELNGEKFSNYKDFSSWFHTKYGGLTIDKNGKIVSSPYLNFTGDYSYSIPDASKYDYEFLLEKDYFTFTGKTKMNVGCGILFDIVMRVPKSGYYDVSFYKEASNAFYSSTTWNEDKGFAYLDFKEAPLNSNHVGVQFISAYNRPSGTVGVKNYFLTEGEYLVQLRIGTTQYNGGYLYKSLVSLPQIMLSDVVANEGLSQNSDILRGGGGQFSRGLGGSLPKDFALYDEKNQKYTSGNFINEADNSVILSDGSKLTLNDWSYDYENRAYNFTANNGTLGKIVYGDENVTTTIISPGGNVTNYTYNYVTINSPAPTPTPTPTSIPSPTPQPTSVPTTSPSPTTAPVPTSTANPTAKPTVTPTANPTANPTAKPTAKPTVTPSPSSPPSGGEDDSEGGIWGAIRRFFKAIFDGIGKILSIIVGGVLDVITACIGKLIEAVVFVFEKIVETLTSVLDFGGEFSDFLASFFSWLPPDIVKLIVLTFALALAVIILRFFIR